MNRSTLTYAVKNLLKRKTRSFLTILSIFIGITTIFIFISFGYGLYNYVGELSSESSADKFIVQAKGVGAPGTDDTFKLLDDDLNTIAKTRGVKEAQGFYFKAVEVEFKDDRKFTYGVGYLATTQNSKIIHELGQQEIVKGRDLRKQDRNKVVLGYNYQFEDKIFGNAVNVGDKIVVNEQKFEVIGFLSAVGNPQDDSQVYMTDEDMKGLYSNETLSYGMILGRVDDTSNIERITDDVRRNLRNERGVDEGEEDFFVQTFDDLIAQFSVALNIIIGFVVLIALISVIVSAINTANTMITSVLERTREIGIMKAIGARNSTIMNIFLLESSILGFVAGVFGVIVGALIANAAGNILESLGWGFLSPYFTWQLFVLLILFATIVGTLSGVTTAIQASKQNPVDALRYE